MISKIAKWAFFFLSRPYILPRKTFFYWCLQHLLPSGISIASSFASRFSLFNWTLFYFRRFFFKDTKWTFLLLLPILLVRTFILAFLLSGFCANTSTRFSDITLKTWLFPLYLTLCCHFLVGVPDCVCSLAYYRL